YIKHGNQWLDDAVNNAIGAAASKADKTYVDSELTKKANKSDTDAALSTKADKSALEATNASVSANTSNIQELSTESTVLSARMDEFTKLSEGSTTGDAELADGRVGADGKTYDNIGGAIRGQVTDLKSDLDDVSNIVLTNKSIIGEIRNNEVVVKSGNTINVISSNGYKALIANVEPRKKYDVYCTVGSDTQYSVGYFCTDESGNIIAQYNIDGSSTNKHVIMTVPDGSSKIYVNGYGITPSIDLIHGENVAFTKSESDKRYARYVDLAIHKEIDVPKVVRNVPKFVYYDGNTDETAGVYAKEIIVTENEKYYVRGNVSAQMAVWATFDLNGNVVSHDSVKRTTSGFVEDNITISPGSHLLRVYGYYNTDISVKTNVIVNNDYSISPLVNKTWVALGDSLTDSITLDGGKNYVDFIAYEVGCNTINMGYGGSGFLKDANNKYYKRVSQIPVETDVITVFGSFNDFEYIADSLGTADDAATDNPTTLGSAMNKFITDLYARCPDINIGFISPISWKWYNPYNKDENTTKSESYVNLLKDVAKKWSIPFLDLFHEANIRIWDNEISRQYTKNNDGTHLTEVAHKKYIYKKVKTFLESIS
ncbi:MAG: SGNH/GDSL hydrolase family protein, partial [Treponema sp.]|nr:SGNH/GDSL hydrolase family protein [Treponema sp.]MDY5757857.1 SGNH/GDSL hydrolase family protein [Treponema sp.]